MVEESEEMQWVSADRESLRLDILSMKKEANLSAREVGEVEVGKGDADLR